MDDLWEKLRKEWYDLWRMPSEDAWRAVASHARELLAKPVATREEDIARWFENTTSVLGYPKTPIAVARLIKDALTHFAPPRQRMMIDGMGFDELNKEMHQAYKVAVMGDGAQLANALSICAATAHRLATTPAPEVDLDAEAKKYLSMWMRVCHPNDAERSDEQIWNCYRQMHDAARSFAAGLKVVRG